MIWNETKDPEGNKLVESDNTQISSTFFDEGCTVYNASNGTVSWNSIGVTQLNLMNEGLSLMYDPENQTLMLSIDGDDENHENDKCLTFGIKELISVIQLNGKTIAEMEAMLAENAKAEKENSGEDPCATCNDAEGNQAACDMCIVKKMREENTDGEDKD